MPPPTAQERRLGYRKDAAGLIHNGRPDLLPTTVWERQCKIPKYWWLRLLQVTPPSPGNTDKLWWEPYIREMQQADDRAAAATKTP